jgi:hypothetical protein
MRSTPARSRSRRANAAIPPVPGYVACTLPFRFIQTPKKVTIINEGDAQIRHVYVNVPHTKNPSPPWYGESVGHSVNGDTLVVETLGISTKSFVDNYRTPHAKKLHVVERFKLIDGGNPLEDTITVEDPGTFTMPWSAVQCWRKTDRVLAEEVCTENNFSYFNFEVAPIPQAAKPDL